MRIFCLVATALLISGCMRWSLDRYLDSAYEAYELGDCAKVRLLLSQADREARSRPYMQPEISLLRGQCLEREGLYADARETYQFIISRYPVSEYAYRAKARLQTLDQLGYGLGTRTIPQPVPKPEMK